jgi:hypothetical protein
MRLSPGEGATSTCPTAGGAASSTSPGTGTPAAGPDRADMKAAHAIEAAREACLEHRRIHGARRLTAGIRDRGYQGNRKGVARFTRAAGSRGSPALA